VAEYRAQFTYSVSLVRSAYFEYLRRRLPVMTVLTVLLLAPSISLWREFGQIAGFGLGIAVMAWIIPLAGLLRTTRTARAAGNPQVELLATEERLYFRMPQAESSVTWAGVRAIYRLTKFWIVVRAGMVNPSVISLDALSLEARAFIEAKVKEAGGRLL
jgi:hypothetical protein